MLFAAVVQWTSMFVYFYSTCLLFHHFSLGKVSSGNWKHIQDSFHWFYSVLQSVRMFFLIKKQTQCELADDYHFSRLVNSRSLILTNRSLSVSSNIFKIISNYVHNVTQHDLSYRKSCGRHFNWILKWFVRTHDDRSLIFILIYTSNLFPFASPLQQIQSMWTCFWSTFFFAFPLWSKMCRTKWALNICISVGVLCLVCFNILVLLHTLGHFCLKTI